MSRTSILAVFLLLTTALTFAQPAPRITTVEHDLGTDCPEAQTVSPDGTAVWVLIHGCFTGGFRLEAYSAEDGSRLDIGGTFSEELDVLRDDYINSEDGIMAFLDDSTLSIISAEPETYMMNRLLISVDGSPIPDGYSTGEALYNIIVPYSEYTEASVFNADQTVAAVVNSTQLTVLDLATGAPILTLPVEEESYNAYPSFSPDGQTLYVATLVDWENFDNYDATITAYSLPDGELLRTFAAPSPFITVSPDGGLAVLEWGSNDGEEAEITVLDTETGAISEPFSTYEGRRKATACTNDGRSLTDLDLTVDGRLLLTGLTWRPDSSGFIITRSYGGDGLGGGRPCSLDTSRLNVFEVARGE